MALLLPLFSLHLRRVALMAEQTSSLVLLRAKQSKHSVVKPVRPSGVHCLQLPLCLLPPNLLLGQQLRRKQLHLHRSRNLKRFSQLLKWVVAILTKTISLN